MKKESTAQRVLLSSQRPARKDALSQNSQCGVPKSCFYLSMEILVSRMADPCCNPALGSWASSGPSRTISCLKANPQVVLPHGSIPSFSEHCDRCLLYLSLSKRHFCISASLCMDFIILAWLAVLREWEYAVFIFLCLEALIAYLSESKRIMEVLMDALPVFLLHSFIAI